MLEPLRWVKRGNVLFAKDGPGLRYRITMKRMGDVWVRNVQLNGAPIGGNFSSLEAAIGYCEYGGGQPRQGGDDRTEGQLDDLKASSGRPQLHASGNGVSPAAGSSDQRRTA